MSDNGGARAISGFLFQALAGGALRAAGECGDYRRPDADELSALIELARVGQVIHEFADEDLVLRRQIIDMTGAVGAEITLVQVKFSIVGLARSIAAKEMRGIIAAFAKAKKRLEKTGVRIGGYVLVTNRSISSANPKLEGAIPIAIYGRLRKVTGAQTHLWHESLARFAQQFGLREPEIVAGRQRLLGLVFETTTSGAAQGAITRDNLLTSFAGDAAARELRPARQAEAIRRQIASFDADVSLQPVRREQLADIETVCAGRALVVFAGEGGSGKTAALHQWAENIAKSTSVPRPMVTLRGARGLPDDWLSELIHEWNPALRPTGRDDALERLEIANTGAVPVLHLGLDGADEYPADLDSSTRMRRLAHWFWQLDEDAMRAASPPRARLVVTCRDAELFARDCVNLRRSGGALAGGRAPLVITFDQFSETELRGLLRANFPTFESQLFRPESGGEATLDAFTLDPSLANPATARHPLAELLRDPVLWRSFCIVTDELRTKLLARDEDAETHLAGHYFERFVEKARVRTGFATHYLRQALGKVAERNRGAGRRFRALRDWQKPACEDSGLSMAETRVLFDEAASGGLIRTQGDVRWDWRNDLIENYLLILSAPSSQ